MWGNIPGLILLSGEFGGDLAISNPDLYSANNGDEGMTVPLLVTQKTVELRTAKTFASSKHWSTQHTAE